MLQQNVSVINKSKCSIIIKGLRNNTVLLRKWNKLDKISRVLEVQAFLFIVHRQEEKQDIINRT